MLMHMFLHAFDDELFKLAGVLDYLKRESFGPNPPPSPQQLDMESRRNALLNARKTIRQSRDMQRRQNTLIQARGKIRQARAEQGANETGTWKGKEPPPTLKMPKDVVSMGGHRVPTIEMGQSIARGLPKPQAGFGGNAVARQPVRMGVKPPGAP